jgi:hypothetical protein
MARTVRDAALLFGVMCGPDERDPSSALSRELRAAPGTPTARGARLCRLAQPGVAGARPSASGRHGADVKLQAVDCRDGRSAGLSPARRTARSRGDAGRVQRGRPAERGRHPGDRRSWLHSARQRAGAGLGRVLGGVHGDRAPSGWRRSAGQTALTSGIRAAVVGLVALPSQDWSRLAHASAPVIAATHGADGSNGSLIAIPSPKTTLINCRESFSGLVVTTCRGRR